MGFDPTRETMVYNVVDDVAGVNCQATTGGGEVRVADGLNLLNAVLGTQPAVRGLHWCPKFSST
jgi:hypothetical protein